MHKVKYLAAVVALIIFLSLIAAQRFWPQNSLSEERVQRHLRFTLEVVNTSASPVQGSEILVSLPVETSRQRIVHSQFSVPSQSSMTSDRGVRRERLSVGNIAPYGRAIIKSDITLELGAGIKQTEDPQHFMQSSSWAPLQHPVIKKHAEFYTAGLYTPESFAQWLSQNITYTGYAAEARGAVYALEQRAGDCTEYSAALVAVLRANAIPARMVVGMVVDEKALLVRSADYHNWVEYFDGRSWVGVDPQFGKSTESNDYLTYQIVDDVGRDSAINLHQRFFSTDSNLKIRIL